MDQRHGFKNGYTAVGARKHVTSESGRHEGGMRQVVIPRNGILNLVGIAGH